MEVKEDEKIDMNIAKKRCRQYRLKILEMSQRVPALHMAPAFSCLEIVDMIYNEIMRRDEENNFIDTFIISKGHGCMGQYVILNDLDVLSDKDLEDYCTPGGCLGAHPDYGVPGVNATTGSLGHGLGIAVGMSIANRLLNKSTHTYVVLSDGELQEGSTWEAILMAGNLQLDNLTIFIDLNDSSTLVKMSVDHPAFYPVDQKFEKFGWCAYNVEDGHNAEQLFNAAKLPQSGKPKVIICKTTKGKGVSYMENVPIWHYRSPNKEEYQQAVLELQES